ncbi:MAG: aldehyde dehydrogenase [Hyphomicrobiales bacterium]|nr:aldehyde dehydrogenase [Hyphomicrobiales bacterium]
MLEQTDIDKLRDSAVKPCDLMIGDKFCDSQNGETLDVVSPINGSLLTTIAAGTKDDANQAISAARAAFEDRRWCGQTPAARKNVLLAWADLIEVEALELTVLGVRDNGTEISMAIKAEVGSAVNTIRYYAEALDKVYGQIAPTDDDVLGLVHHEPVGVIGAIVPWNFPLMIGAWKLAPALAMGNSVVLKPSETASLSLLRICQLALDAGLPEGVLNVVSGRGDIVGEAISLSMDVDVIAFTGSGTTGRCLLENSARSNMKRCYLELGGKSPNVVFEDVENLSEAAKTSAAGIFRNSGQVCVAASRLVVQQSIHDEFVEELAKHAAAMKVGNPLEITTQSGAINNSGQLKQDLKFVEIAQAEGANLYQGGRQILQDTGGYYMEPTIFTNVKSEDSLARNEVFGPVLAVSAFEDEADATTIANSTDFGLAAGIWTADLSRAHRMVRSLRAGVVHVNTYGGTDITVPLGGVKQSGNGHDKSMHAFDKYCDLKTAWIKL